MSLLGLALQPLFGPLTYAPSITMRIWGLGMASMGSAGGAGPRKEGLAGWAVGFWTERFLDLKSRGRVPETSGPQGLKELKPGACSGLPSAGRIGSGRYASGVLGGKGALQPLASGLFPPEATACCPQAHPSRDWGQCDTAEGLGLPRPHPTQLGMTGV